MENILFVGVLFLTYLYIENMSPELKFSAWMPKCLVRWGIFVWHERIKHFCRIQHDKMVGQNYNHTASPSICVSPSSLKGSWLLEKTLTSENIGRVGEQYSITDLLQNLDAIGNYMHSPVVSYEPNVLKVKRFPSLWAGNAQPHSYRIIMWC